nr:PREDICTED: zinc finger and BTB domain-containing protein 7C isoform X1 [Latimeria chalumnae]|eukprot:XP_006005070.1 PREDICTED: zinc finger and BTB domain-containing protein 7C isoform X1 [Latimeria chalumnae]
MFWRTLNENMASGDDDLIGIPFPNHSSEVLSSLNEQRHDGLLCDVVLIVKDQEYRTHRSVLAACSKYFKKLFTTGTLADQPHVYEIDFVSPEALSAILEFAYTSTLTITTSNVKDVLSAARMLEIQCVISVCLEIMDTSGEAEEAEEEAEPVDLEKQGSQTDAPETNCFPSPSKSERTDNQYVDRPRDFQNVFPSHHSSSHLGVLRDFSIESLLKESLYPRVSIPDRRPTLSPLAPGFFPPMWNGDFGVFSPAPEPQDLENGPLDLVIRKGKVKEERKEELPPVAFSNDFFNEIFAENARGQLGHIKAENDYSAYLNFLSASHLGGVFPPWPLEEERKIKPKASQQCPICNKVIMGAGKLPRHMRTHTGEKPYMCNICEVRFTRQDKLKIHMRKHTGERPYTCIHCNAKFVHNYDLKNHMRIHTGVRPYQCEHCYKSFTRSDHLHRHIKRQSCRISRPRRGRKPSAWRAASLLYAQSSQQDDKGFLQASLEERNGPLGSSSLMGMPVSSEKQYLEDGSHMINLEGGFMNRLEDSEARLLERNHMEAERNRGIFAFTLTHSSSLSPRQYFSSSEPWGTGLNHRASIPEASK